MLSSVSPSDSQRTMFQSFQTYQAATATQASSVSAIQRLSSVSASRPRGLYKLATLELTVSFPAHCL